EPDDQCNVCDVHVDFMFGTEDMEITATLLDGTQTPIMRNGVWAF
ncbi:MAG: aminopeptidase, partial [Eubacteriales bacterium]|nr:aminopeptidase [Eubacteriales bacterium]